MTEVWWQHAPKVHLLAREVYILASQERDFRAGHKKLMKCNKKLSVICYLLSESVGQTMLEVLIALTLIMFFLTGIAIVQLYSMRNVDYSENKSIAARLARQQLERARVVRDSVGINALSICQTTCFINSNLTPIPLTPTGFYGQSLVLQTATALDCPLPDVTITPVPTSFKATSTVTWSQNAAVTPVQTQLSSCITDWR